MMKKTIVFSSTHGLTQILNIFISKQADGTTRRLGSRLGSSSLRLVDNDAICHGSGQERGAVRELGHAAIVVHAQPGEGVSNSGENERHMPVFESENARLVGCVKREPSQTVFEKIRS